MIFEAFKITLIGMGGVFAFLILLIMGMGVLRRLVERTNKSSSADKVAVAIALAQSQE